MISSEEFQQTLQAGQIQEAFALIVRDLIELDITTQMTEDSKFMGSEYLRTKINLLTGEIQNEVGNDIIINSDRYTKLQQLHIDQIVASHQIVRDYLDRIQSMIAVLSPTSIAVDIVGSDRLNLDCLVTPGTQVTAILTDSSSSQEFKSTTATDSIEIDVSSVDSIDSIDSSTLSEHQQSPPITNHISTELPVYNVADDDDGIDLSIDPEGTVWEEWIEDEESIITQPKSTSPASIIPDCEEHSIRRNFYQIDIKPSISRSTVESVDSSTQWDKFGPEHIGIHADRQPPLNHKSDSHQMERLLADLDIK
jgi:hypothetical protein